MHWSRTLTWRFCFSFFTFAGLCQNTHFRVRHLFPRNQRLTTFLEVEPLLHASLYGELSPPRPPSSCKTSLIYIPPLDVLIFHEPL